MQSGNMIQRGLSVAACLSLFIAFSLSSDAGVYVNPVVNADYPDPGVFWDPKTSLWWAAATGCASASGNCFAQRVSTDLARWSEPVGYIFPTMPSWSDGSTAWAPEIHITNAGTYNAYFATRNKQGTLVVGVAVAKQAAGPFEDVLGAPFIQAPSGSCFGVIDPTFFRDHTGTQWVVFKEDGNSCGKPTNIYAAMVDETGTIFKSGWVLMISNDPSSWEGGCTEAPWVMRNETTGDLFLFYSGSYFNVPSYSIGVARSTSGSMLGPWVKYENNPIIRSAPGAGTPGSKLHYGPGHCSVVVPRDSPSTWALVYAAEVPGGGARNGMLDVLSWTNDGWPVVAGRYPSNTTQPIP